MADEIFTDPDDERDEWVDVRMTDPEAGEWDVDVVVAEGHVEFLDLRVRPEYLAGFLECLVDDVDDEQARTVLRTVADRRSVSLGDDRRDDRRDADREE